MLIVKKENLVKIIAGCIEEEKKEDIIKKLQETWGDDEGNLVIKNAEYDFWGQENGYRYFDCELDENKIEEYTEGTRYFGLMSAEHSREVNSKGFVQFITEDKVVDFVNEQISSIEVDEDDVELKEEIEAVKKIIESGETDLENYCFKHSDLIIGSSESVVELYKVENEEDIYTFLHDSKEYRLEIFRGDYFVKEIK